MQVATFNGVKVYNLSSGKTLPMWVSERKKRALSKDEDYRHRVELIQDFEFPTASQRIRMSADGQHIVATGTYPPNIKVFTVSDLSLKFERRLDCECVDFKILSDDYSKLVFLLADRSLAFHAAYGAHYSLRVPKFGRHLEYCPQTCDLVIASSSNELYVFNLAEGRFKEPLRLSYSGCNRVCINPVMDLLAAGGEGAIVQFFDTRSMSSVSTLNLSNLLQTTGSSERVPEVTALSFNSDGLTFCAGTSSGHCMLFDIRSKTPLHVKEHQYGLPICNITFHNGARKIISSDKKLVKIWEKDGEVGKVFTNIETPADINDACLVSDDRGETGMIMLAGEQRRIMTYFVPQLGPAPRWCSFLESITEELEEQNNVSVYDDFKFVTQKEVEDLGATSLIGTNLLKGYMHGFFIDMKLYSKLRAVANPFEFDEWRKKKIREKIEERRQSRITLKRRLPKVNKQLAEKMIRSSNDDNVEVSNPLGDSRFGGMFTNPDFQIYEESEEFQRRHPSRLKRRADADSDDDGLLDEFEKVEVGEPSIEDDDDQGDQSEESDLDQVKYADSDDDVPRSSGPIKKPKNRMQTQEEDGGEIMRASVGKRRSVQLYEMARAKPAGLMHTEEARAQRKQMHEARTQPLGQRLQSHETSDKSFNGSGRLRTIRSEQGLVREYSYQTGNRGRRSSRGGGRGRGRGFSGEQDRDSREQQPGGRFSRGRGRGRGRGGGRGGGRGRR